MRKLAYEIRQRTEADYRFFRFETESPLLDELNHNLKITDGVLRFRIFKVDPESPVIEPPPPVSLASSARRPPPAVAGGRRGREPRARRPRRPRLAPAAPRRRRRAARRLRRLRRRGARRRGPAPASRPRQAPAAARGSRRGARAAAPPSRQAPAEAAPAPSPPRPSRRPSKAAASAFLAFPGGENAPISVLDWGRDQSELREVLISSGSKQHQRSRHHGEPDPRSRAAQHQQRDERVRAAGRGQLPPQGPERRVGRQAQLLRRHGLGRPGRELLDLPEQGPSGGGRGPARLARVGGEGRVGQAPGGRDHRQLGAVPRQPRRRRTGQRKRLPAPQSDVPADTSDFESSQPAAVGASDDDIPF